MLRPIVLAEHVGCLSGWFLSTDLEIYPTHTAEQPLKGTLNVDGDQQMSNKCVEEKVNK
jgi:hypothetical protein